MCFLWVCSQCGQVIHHHIQWYYTGTDQTFDKVQYFISGLVYRHLHTVHHSDTRWTAAFVCINRGMAIWKGLVYTYTQQQLSIQPIYDANNASRTNHPSQYGNLTFTLTSKHTSRKSIFVDTHKSFDTMQDSDLLDSHKTLDTVHTCMMIYNQDTSHPQSCYTIQMAQYNFGHALPLLATRAMNT